MTDAPQISISEPAVLGVSVIDDEIATVVRDATGEIVASNHVELSDDSPGTALEALTELVDSAPFAIDHIVVTCARPSVRSHLDFSLQSPGAPTWAQSVSFVDLPHVLAHVAQGAVGGVAGVVVLGSTGAPALGSSVAVVDADRGSVLRAAEIGDTQAIAVTEPRGAGGLASQLGSLSPQTPPNTIVAVGSGAQLPEAIAAIETATRASVTVVAAPIFASAQGATELISAETRAIPVTAAAAPVAFAEAAGAGTTGLAPGARSGGSLRWWVIGGAIGVAAMLCLFALVALVTGGDDDRTPAAVTSTVTAPAATSEVTVTRTGRTATETETVVNEVTVTRTQTLPPETSTVPVTVTETAAPTATVTEQQIITSVVTSILEVPSESGVGG